MHIVVSWDISASGSRLTEVNEQMRQALKGYSWARPLKSFYVVRVASEEQRKDIRDKLLAVAKSVAETVHFVVSPVMAGGRYDGYLPRDMWAKLNERSDA
ncbi:MAG: hypothetical protein WBA49_13350 [Rhodanobacter lindaniclasticus]